MLVYHVSMSDKGKGLFCQLGQKILSSEIYINNIYGTEEIGHKMCTPSGLVNEVI
jgi:hypothetical protein